MGSMELDVAGAEDLTVLLVTAVLVPVPTPTLDPYP